MKISVDHPVPLPIVRDENGDIISRIYCDRQYSVFKEMESLRECIVIGNNPVNRTCVILFLDDFSIKISDIKLSKTEKIVYLTYEKDEVWENSPLKLLNNEH